MEELFNRLEAKITSLIQQCEILKEANKKLILDTSLLVREKDILQAKNKEAISQIESMVFRLKLLEKPQ